MILETLALLALTRVDPAGDAHGDGSLAPPTAPVYATMAPFDLVEVSVLDRPELTFRVRLAGMPNPGGLRHGITLPVVDLYLDADVDGGLAELLPGPNMVMPAGRGWDVAVRITGDLAYARTADDVDGPPLPVEVTRDDDALVIATALPRPETLHELHALTGVYDPFSDTGWRPVASAPSPWAFSSDAPHPPVIDLTADDDDAQRTALATGVLPERIRAPGAGPWVWLMLGGVAVAVVGLAARRFGPTEAPVSTDARDEPAGAATSDSAAAATESAVHEAAEAGEATEAGERTEAPEAPEPARTTVASAPREPKERPQEASDGSDAPKPIDADDLAAARDETAGTSEGRTLVLGRVGRKAEKQDGPESASEPAAPSRSEEPATTGLAASAVFRGSSGGSEAGDDAGSAETRRLRTHWAENDGWWLEDPDDVDVGEGWTRLEATEEGSRRPDPEVAPSDTGSGAQDADAQDSDADAHEPDAHPADARNEDAHDEARSTDDPDRTGSDRTGGSRS